VSLVANQFQTFRFAVNRGRKAKVRPDSFEGRKHLVAPAAVLEEGVIEGSDGAVFYPDSEIANAPFVANCNHRPMVLYHPLMEGKPISACDPAILDANKLGVTFNTSKQKKLHMECWFDDTRIDGVEPRIRPALNTCAPMELSTGVYFDLDPTPGEYKGRKYKGIARGLRLDHLAILPDQIGAYSVAMGGGLFAANAAGVAVAAGDVSFDFITCALNALLRDRFGQPGVEWYGCIVDVMSGGTFVYRADGKLWRLGYAVEDDAVTLQGEPEEVSRVVTYQAASTAVVGNSTITPTRETVMPVPKVKIDELLALNVGYGESHRPQFEGMDEKVYDLFVAPIKTLAANQQKAGTPAANEATTGTPAPQTGTTTPTGNATVTQSGPTMTGNQVLDLLRQADPSLAAEFDEIRQFRAETKKTLVANLLKHPANRFTEPQLNAKELGELQAIADMAGAGTPTGNASGNPGSPAYRPNYRGAAGAPPTGNAAPEVKPMKRPTYNWGGTPAGATQNAGNGAAQN
jgi:hypothetical protein